MARYQGEFDGLCGMYAIANAYEQCGYGDHCDQLFQIACSALALRRWPQVLWDGTSFGDMQRMIAACNRDIAENYEETIDVQYPFFRNTPNTNAAYWQRFDDIFHNEDVYCGIIGLTHPWQHWVVISRDTKKRVWFVDSDVGEPEYRKNLSSLYAGERRRLQTQWRLDRRELIVFSEVGATVNGE